MNRYWTGTWAAAPQWTEPADLPPPPFTRFADSTLRQSVRVSAGGRRVRLRFSNAYGDTSLAVDAVRIAVPLGGQAGNPFDAAVRDPRDPRRVASALDCGDHLHLSPAGYQALADAVPVSLFGTA